MSLDLHSREKSYAYYLVQTPVNRVLHHATLSKVGKVLVKVSSPCKLMLNWVTLEFHNHRGLHKYMFLTRRVPVPQAHFKAGNNAD